MCVFGCGHAGIKVISNKSRKKKENDGPCAAPLLSGIVAARGWADNGDARVGWGASNDGARELAMTACAQVSGGDVCMG